MFHAGRVAFAVCAGFARISDRPSHFSKTDWLFAKNAP
jgi:hypothetical protein